MVSGSCRRVPGGKNSRAKLIINIYIYFFTYVARSDGSSIIYIIYCQHVCVNKINNIKYSKYNFGK